MDEVLNRDERQELLDRYAYSRKPLPLIMNEYCYEFFGQAVKITEVNLYDKVENAEVTVASSDFTLHRTQFSELEWNPGRNFRESIYMMPVNDFVKKGMQT